MNPRREHSGRRSPAERRPAPRPEAERALIEGLKAGEEAAYDSLVRSEGWWMRGLARRVLRSEVEANDAVQDALLSLYRGIAKYDGRAALNTWLYRIVLNAALMRLRSRRRRPEQIFEHRLLDETLPDAESSAEEEVGAWQLEERMIEQIRTLPERYRRVIELMVLEGVSLSEAARRLDITESCARVRLHRARRKLRKHLEGLDGSGDLGSETA